MKNILIVTLRIPLMILMNLFEILGNVCYALGSTFEYLMDKTPETKAYKENYYKARFGIEV